MGLHWALADPALCTSSCYRDQWATSTKLLGLWLSARPRVCLLHRRGQNNCGLRLRTCCRLLKTSCSGYRVRSAAEGVREVRQWEKDPLN